MATVWNAADKSAAITLSSTNHVATTAGGNNGVRSTPTTHASGKWYFEYPVLNTGGAGSGLYGIANTTYNYGSTSADTTNAAGLDTSGNAAVNAGSFNPGWGTPNGHHLSIAVDFDNHKIWFRYDGGNWNNDILANQNPATNTGGYGIGTFAAAAVMPMVRMQNSGNVTLNAGDSAMTFATPSGFTIWDFVPPFTPSQCAVLS